MEVTLRWLEKCHSEISKQPCRLPMGKRRPTFHPLQPSSGCLLKVAPRKRVFEDEECLVWLKEMSKVNVPVPLLKSSVSWETGGVLHPGPDLQASQTSFHCARPSARGLRVPSGLGFVTCFLEAQGHWKAVSEWPVLGTCLDGMAKVMSPGSRHVPGWIVF